MGVEGWQGQRMQRASQKSSPQLLLLGSSSEEQLGCTPSEAPAAKQAQLLTHISNTLLLKYFAQSHFCPQEHPACPHSRCHAQPVREGCETHTHYSA